MTRNARNHADDVRGASRLAIDATRGVTSLVEAMHVAIASGPAALGQPLAGPVRLATAPVYAIIRGVTQLVGAGVDLALAQLAPVLGASAPSLEREATLAALNGVLGDHLSERGNPLAITMRLRHGGEPLALAPESLRRALPRATGRLVVLIHGLCTNDLQWARGGHDHGAALERDLGYTPVYVHYNTGLHISTNGRELAGLLEQLVAAWPVAPEELVLIGHSMGGLVARSACHAAEQAGHAWRRRLGALITLGSPHHGAPLERGGQGIDLLLGLHRYTAPLGRVGRVRSAGITDLRFGNVLDEHWQGLDRFAHRRDTRSPLDLPRDVACYAIAGALVTAAGYRLPGDGLVRVASAFGVHERPELTLAFPEAHCWLALGTGHVGLLGAPTVYETIRSWLSFRTPA
ncbi:MAG: alpha/beta hydrolase [Deltaproteobacteria bacterium]|nr:MAG: alpha/beta hydrolase [Deltaproteobacteria bacterium]